MSLRLHFFFARTLGSQEVKAGITRPENIDMESLYYFLQSSETWTEYEQIKVKTALEAFDSNENCNTRKSKCLKKAESLLFLGVPSSAFLAVCLAFAYGCVAHGRWISAPVSVVAGIALGAFVSALILFVTHARS